jgi:HEAT repeats
MCKRLLGCPAFLIELTRKERFSLRKLLQVSRSFAGMDPSLDIRLANLLPGRREDPYGLRPEIVARILEVLNDISVGPKLILPLGHLTSHPHPAVAEKAALLIGRRIHNFGWLQRRLESGGPGIRAGVLEGLWGSDTPQARRTMRKYLNDTSERVVGNAVFGLHLLRESDSVELVGRMLSDERPAFRATAAYLAGRIGTPEVNALLRRARNDDDAFVRLAAKQSMVQLRRTARMEEERRHALAAAAGQPAAESAAKPPEVPHPVRTVRTGAVEPAGKLSERRVRVRLDGTKTTTRWD